MTASRSDGASGRTALLTSLTGSHGTKAHECGDAGPFEQVTAPSNTITFELRHRPAVQDRPALSGAVHRLHLRRSGVPGSRRRQIDPEGRFIPRPCNPSDVKWCQEQCDQRRLRSAGCKCFGLPICLGFLLCWSLSQASGFTSSAPPSGGVLRPLDPLQGGLVVREADL